MKVLLYCVFIFLGFSIYAEIQTVAIKWNPISCPKKCGELLQSRLNEIPQVTETQVDLSSGWARLKWKENASFSYPPIKQKMQSVGVGVDDIRVKVKGKVNKQGKKLSFVSTGDGTKFLLMAPIQADPNRYASPQSAEIFSLPPDLEKRILEASQGNQELIIEGPLYRPAALFPIQLIVERFQQEKKK